MMTMSMSMSKMMMSSSNKRGSNLLCLCLLMLFMVLVPPVLVLADDDTTTTTTTDVGTELNGGITTRQDVSYLSDLILDIRDIDQSFASAGGSNAAISIYLNGKNSDPQEDDVTGTKMSLSQLTSRLFQEGIMTDNTPPTYIFHLFGMADRSTDIDKLNENLFYADSFIRSSIMASRKSTALAMNVLGVWMYATQRLYEAASKCQLKVEADNPSIIDYNDAKYYDEFIALWIGSSQIPGSSQGYSLYALAEQGDEIFSIGEVTSSDAENNLDEDAIESLVNKRIKLLYQEGASLLSSPNVCTKDTPETPKQLWTITNRIVSQMYIPLIQLLIDSLLKQDTESVQALSLALIPQISQCRPSTYKSLKDELLFSSDNGIPNYDRSETIIRQLQSIYPCFGLTCDDIGVIRIIPDGQKVVAIPACQSADNDAPMAQYQPGTDVLPIARIDHDILQIRILTSLGSFFNARLLYTYGRNSPLEYYSSSGTGNNDIGGLDGAIGFYSLKDFATSATRKNSEPYFSMFVSYHNDPNYAHNIITQTLLGDGKWGSSTSSFEQRSAMITETSSFQVLYLHLLGQMYASINICHGTTSTGTVRDGAGADNADGEDYDQEGYYKLTHPWDEVAALIIGSLEGTSEGGSSDIQDGQLIWGLSTRRGFQFQTLNDEGYPKVNSELEDLLFAGRGELDALDCTALEETVEKIRQLTLVPMFQSILRYAVQNQQYGNSVGPSQDLALGEAYALAVLPIIQSSDPEAGQIIEENMIVQSGVQPTRDGSQIVADAVGSAAISEGLRCKLLGSIPDAEPCSSAYDYRRSLFLFVSSAVLTLFFVIL